MYITGGGNQLEGNYIGTDAAGTEAIANDASGLYINTPFFNQIGGTAANQRNVISGNDHDGIRIDGNNHVVQGNYIGVNAAGTAALANGGNGVWIQFGTNNTIGGTVVGAGNVISGNGANGVYITNDGNTVAGNTIGLDAAGTAALGNGATGIWAESDSNVIGGNTAAARNVISASDDDGLLIRGSLNAVTGNYIGLNAAGTAALANDANGILVETGTGNTIGGTAAGERNVVSGNAGSGIRLISDDNVVLGNYLGTDATGTAAIGNSYDGVVVVGSGNRIGSAAAGGGNLLSGNEGNGVNVAGADAVVLGNIIGTNAAGTAALPNLGFGVAIAPVSTNATVGGTAAGEGNLISGNATGGILIDSDGHLVLGNRIGTDAAGTAALANGTGISLYGNDNTIGGTVAGAGNLISGNARGSEVFGHRNLFLGNLVGTNAAGTAAVGNTGVGIHLIGDDNVVGGAAVGARNLISGNGDGVVTSGDDNVVSGNYIGTNAAGTAAIANAGPGVWTPGNNNTVGGTTAAEGNLISGNNYTGVYVAGSGNVVSANTIGLNAAGDASLANAVAGVSINSGSGHMVGGTTAGTRNVISGNTGSGVYVQSDANTVSGNYIGTNAAGDAAIGNGGNGIEVDGDGNTVGGTTAAERNVISGNTQSGARVDGSSNTVSGNYIGTNAAGTAAIGNGDSGVFVSFGTGNLIGGTTAAARNIISGNNVYGVYFGGGSGTTVAGNYIGTDATGTAAIANILDGVHLNAGTGHIVGGTVTGAGNVISGNALGGVSVVSSDTTVAGNIIGLNAAGTTALANASDGIIVWSSGNTIGGTVAAARNVVAGNGFAGIGLYGNSNTVQGNYVGIAADGTTGLGNGEDGVYVAGTGNVIGGTAVGAGNVISGNLNNGILLFNGAASNTVQGNLIGTDAAGTGALSNGWSNIVLNASHNNTIGGTSAAARNVISGSAISGMVIYNGATGNTVQGNYIGTNAAGNVAAGFGNADMGVHLIGAVSGNTIGGTAAGAGNVIAGNARDGVHILASLTLIPSGNAVLGNAIHSNGGLGIDLATDTDGDLTADASVGATPNDAGDADTGANALQNFPVLSAAFTTGAQVRMLGSLNSTAGTNYRVEFFAGTSGDASGHGEGQRYLGFVNVTTDGSGNASFDTTLAAAVSAGEAVSATATNLTTNDTSEFALNVAADLNDAPAITSNGGGDTAAVSVVENTTTAVTTVAATDADVPAQTLTYAIAGGADAARFSINGSTGILTFATAANFEAPSDADADNVYQLTVSVSDGTGGSDTQALSVTVTDLARNTVVVTTTADTADGDTSSLTALQANRGADGQISLREAITAASNTVNESGGADRISFNIAAALVGGAHTITLASVLPNITDTVVIDGSTEPDYAGTPIIELNAGATTGFQNGLSLSAGSGGSTVRGLIINRAGFEGIGIDAGSNGNTIVGNYIGTNAAGTAAQGNGGAGIDIRSNGNIVGGTAASERNVISGNVYHGVILLGGANSNVIQGNYIGVNAAGTAALGNGQYGIALLDSPNNTIGGTAAGAGNVVSGSGETGIVIGGLAATGNVVQGNRVGTNAAGTAAIANGVGIYVGSANNTIGGTTAVARNVVSGNINAGIAIVGADATGNLVQGNYVGLDAAGTGAIGNTWSGMTIDNAAGNTIGGAAAGAGNVISGNGSIGLALLGAGSSGNRVQGNYIGLNAAGTAAVGNGAHGIDINDAPNNTIGGSAAGAGNVISGNGDVGILIQGASTDTVVQGNWVGTNAAGSAAVGNLVGISVRSSGNTVGGTTAAARNVFSGNAIIGVSLFSPGAVITGNRVQGNYIGTDTVGNIAAGLGNGEAGVQLLGAVSGCSASVNVAENTTAVTTVSATDADLPAQSLTYSLIGGADQGLFSIDPSTGALSFNTAPNFEAPGDVGANNVYEVTVQVSDGNGGTDTQAIAVTVTDANDAPIITSNGGGVTASVTVAENTTAVTTVSATDADLPAQSLTYSILSGADAARFTIDGSTGALSFIAAPDFEAPGDADSDNVYDVTVQASDGSLSDAQAISVTVTAVNDAPVNTVPASIPVTEDVASALTGISIADVDAASGTVLVTFSVPSGTLAATSGGGVTVGGSGSALTLTGTVANINAFIAASNVTFTTALNATAPVTLTVTSNDQGNSGSGGAQSDSDPVTLTVTAVNDPPVNTVPGAQTVAEDTALAFTGANTISVNDVDGNLFTTQLTVSNGTLTVSLVGGASISAGANGTNTLTLAGTQAAINATLATLSYQAVADFNGADTLTVLSSDSAGVPLTDTDLVRSR